MLRHLTDDAALGQRVPPGREFVFSTFPIRQEGLPLGLNAP